MNMHHTEAAQQYSVATCAASAGGCENLPMHVLEKLVRRPP